MGKPPKPPGKPDKPPGKPDKPPTEPQPTALVALISDSMLIANGAALVSPN